MIRYVACLLTVWVVGGIASADDLSKRDPRWESISRHFTPPAEFAGQLGPFRPVLTFDDGTPVHTPDDWGRRRNEIRTYWHGVMGAWPAVLEKPRIEFLESTTRDAITQHKVKVETAAGQMTPGYILLPPGEGPFPAVFVPFYDAETSAGINPKSKPFRDFAWQLTRRGFVTLSIGSPGGDARKPDTAGNVLQPLSYLGYVAANGYQALASLPYVDASRIGIVGHSYGGKWAMFGSCLYDKFAAAAWSDGGVVFDEPRSNVNYWEPWYLGLEPGKTRKPGLLSPEHPRMGAYKKLVESGHDLHELHALMAPRPFLVSGGSEDPPSRWTALHHTVAVNKLIGFENRVGMTNRPKHDPNEESNEVIYRFFEHFLGTPAK